MKFISHYWKAEKHFGGDIGPIFYTLRNKPTKATMREGYEYGKNVIRATFQASCENDGWYGDDRQTLQAAVNDGIKYFKKTGSECEIYAHWTETDESLSGNIRWEDPNEDAGFVGYVSNELFNMGNIDWLT